MTQLLVMGIHANVYHNTTSKVLSFDYSGFEYTYTDANGELQTARLTDEATSAEQIAALLKAVYVNPEIPGILYGWDYNGTQSRKLNYNEYGHCLINQSEGFPWQRAAAGETFPNPNDDGMTLLMVSVADNWKASYGSGVTPLEYIRRCYTSARVMTAFTRVRDSENPGYLFQINDVSANRFFFISKGKPRASYTRPLYRLFEQISPVKGDGGHSTDDFIDEIRAGRPYLCYHDCTDVGTIGGSTPHWFTISDKGEHFNLSNITIFIPDRRFEPQNDPTGKVGDNVRNVEVGGKPYFKDYGNSNNSDQSQWLKEFMPKVLVYTVDLQATATPSEEDGYYDVTLNWDTNFTYENMNADIPQHFYVYVVDGNNRVRLATIVDQPTQLREHTYRVEQTNDPQNFSYIVTAAPINYDNNGQILVDGDRNPVITISAESPVRSVVIPGRESAFFTQAQEYRSRFEVKNSNQQYNVYKNKMTVKPSSADDYLSIKNNQESYAVTRTDNQGDKTIVAYVQFTPVEGTQQYEYTVTYNGSSQVLDPVFDDEEPVTSGMLTGYDNSSVVVIDRFVASTKDNDHSDKYIYAFEQQEGDEMVPHSNSFTVPVYKTSNVVGGQEHSFEEIQADTDHGLKAIPSNSITFDAISDPSANLTQYEVFRADYQYKKLTKIAKAEHSNNFDKYSLYTVSEDGMINDNLGTVTISDDNPTITLLDYNNKNYNQQMLYVPVITALYNGDATKKNTYGCDFKTMYYPQVELKVNYMEKTTPFAGPTGPMMGFRTDMVVTPKIPSMSGMLSYYVRVWRVIDGETTLMTETLLNTQDDISGNDQEGNLAWATEYSQIKNTFPQSAPSVVDIFLDYALQSGDTKNITYIARLYATTLSEDEVPTEGMEGMRAPRRGAVAGDGLDYFIAEAQKTVRFDRSVITGVTDMSSEAEVAEIVYYNVLGIPSRHPYAGVNIVETRYVDGKVSTKKVIR